MPIRYASSFKYSPQMESDSEFFAKFVKEEAKKIQFSAWKKSLKAFLFRIDFGHERDDYLKDLKTCIILFNAYKIPRIINATRTHRRTKSRNARRRMASRTKR